MCTHDVTSLVAQDKGLEDDQALGRHVAAGSGP